MAGTIRSLVPARMDRLPWSSFHWRVVIALGITWVLEGVEIGLASAIGGILSNPQHRDETLHMDAAMVGYAGAVYLIGEIVGALYFGRMADKLGRRRLFIVTLALYLIANGSPRSRSRPGTSSSRGSSPAWASVASTRRSTARSTS